MFYDRYAALCAQRDIRPSTAAELMGISKATVTSWKKNPDAVPNGELLRKVMDYFGVSADYLLGRTASPDGEEQLDGVYFNFAKDAQESGIHPDDIRLAIETIKKLRGL